MAEVDPNAFYAPPHVREGAIVYEPSKQQAITGELMVDGHECATYQRAGAPKVPATWMKAAHPGQILWSFVGGSDTVTDSEAAVPVRSVLRGFGAGGDNTGGRVPTDHQDATRMIIPRGVCVRPTEEHNPRIGAVHRGNATVVVHDAVVLGDRLHAVFPRVTANFPAFITPNPGVAQPDVKKAFPLLAFAKNRSTLIPPQLPTLHVYPEKTLLEQGDLVSVLGVLDALVDPRDLPDDGATELTIQPAAPGAPPADVIAAEIVNPLNHGSATQQIARAIFELCVDAAQHAGGAAANVTRAGVRRRFEDIRNNVRANGPAKKRISKTLARLNAGLIGARRQTFIGRARRSANAGDTCDITVDCLASTNESFSSLVFP